MFTPDLFFDSTRLLSPQRIINFKVAFSAIIISIYSVLPTFLVNLKNKPPVIQELRCSFKKV